MLNASTSGRVSDSSFPEKAPAPLGRDGPGPLRSYARVSRRTESTTHNGRIQVTVEWKTVKIRLGKHAKELTSPEERTTG